MQAHARQGYKKIAFIGEQLQKLCQINVLKAIRAS